MSKLFIKSPPFSRVVSRMLLLVALMALPPMPHAYGTESPVRLEPIEGSSLQRITLTARAVERLDIQTTAVSEQVIRPTLMVGGIIHKDDEGGGRVLRVSLSQGEWERLAKDKPVRVLRDAALSDPSTVVYAESENQAAVEDPVSGMWMIDYRLRPDSVDLKVGDRFRVEMQQAGDSAGQLVVPYSAIYYGARGETWVYVSPEQRVYQREEIVVERIAGDWAVLSSGPAVGTQVVTVGAALLYGTELFGK